MFAFEVKASRRNISINISIQFVVLDVVENLTKTTSVGMFEFSENLAIMYKGKCSR